MLACSTFWLQLCTLLREPTSRSCVSISGVELRESDENEYGSVSLSLQSSERARLHWGSNRVDYVVLLMDLSIWASAGHPASPPPGQSLLFGNLFSREKLGQCRWGVSRLQCGVNSTPRTLDRLNGRPAGGQLTVGLRTSVNAKRSAVCKLLFWCFCQQVT